MLEHSISECLLPGYHITELLCDGAIIALYRGYRHHDRHPVLIKLLQDDYRTPKYLDRLKREYEVLHQLAIPGISRTLDLEPSPLLPALILDDGGGQLWKNVLAQQSPTPTPTPTPTIGEILAVAGQVVAVLMELHDQQIVHQQIQPNHILVDLATHRVQLLTAGLPDWFTKTWEQGTGIEESIWYMSPEQTGRMNQTVVDYRTDFYSLGITLYQALVGELPFPSRDLNELVHCHVAKQPIALHDRDPRIPIALSQIVAKLLQKMPQDRYQSAYGLQADLQACAMALALGEAMDDFVVGQADVASELRIPTQLYGRQSELEALRSADSCARANQRQFLVITGESGVGKSLLVQKFQSGLNAAGLDRPIGYFVVGRCDQFRHEVPYLAISHACQNLIRQLLTESETRIQVWRQRLFSALDGNAQVLIEVIPELGLLLNSGQSGQSGQSGESKVMIKPVQRLDTVEAEENRFSRLFRSLVHVFAQPSHPLVVFLDDLQWIDTASLKLLQQILNETKPHALLLLGAYRTDIEVSVKNESRPPVSLDRIRALVAPTSRKSTSRKSSLKTTSLRTTSLKTTGYQEINLATFDLDEMATLVGDVVHQSGAPNRALAQLILDRTQGNPFFAHQLLEFLYRERLLAFSASEGCWRWDLDEIRQLGVTETVVELMERQIRKLPAPTQHILKLAACLGEEFELTTLADLGNLAVPIVTQQLLAAVREGLVVALTATTPRLEPIAPHDAFKFLHDRVRQAAYQLMDQEERQTLHLHVGQRLLQRMLATRQDEQLFEVVNQLNLGKAQMHEPRDRQELAHLNLHAGQKAKMAAAYQAALGYFAAGVSLLAKTSWEQDYHLTLKLWMEQAEAQYLCGDFVAAEASFEQIHPRTKTPVEQADVYSIQMTCYINQNRYREASYLGRAGLARLGLHIPEQLDASTLEAADRDLQAQLARHSLDALRHLPTCNDATLAQIMRLLQYLAAVAISYDRHLYTWIIIKMVALSLEQGNTDRAAYAYVAYGTILSSAQSNYDWGDQLGQVALQLSSEFNALRGITQFSYGGLLAHWRMPFMECRRHLQEAFQHCYNMGELLYALYTDALSTDIAIIGGIALETVQQEIEKSREFALARQHPTMLRDAWVKQQFVRSLRGLTEDAASFSSEDIQEADLLAQLQKPETSPSTLSRYCIYKAQSLYLFGHYVAAEKMIEASSTIVDCHFGPAIVVEHYFFQALILTARYEEVDPVSQGRYWQTLQTTRQRLQVWASNCPPNFAAKWHILEAELQRLAGQDPTEQYDEAINMAQAQGIDALVAIANELAGKYYWKLGRQRIARSYLSDACIAYSHWGAIAKVTALQQECRSLFALNNAYTASPRLLLEPLGATPTALQTLDWMTVIKTSQALSGEMVFSDLMTKLLTILMENAGAQRGVLLARTGQQLQIEAEGQIEQGAISTSVQGNAPTAQDLPLSLITYVDRTHETVVLDHALEDSRFLADPYVQEQQLKSVLCFPMFYQGQPTGILYLENRLISGAFTPTQLEVLKLLTAQVTISIENARLYGNLQNYSQELEGKNHQMARSQTQLKAQAQQLETALSNLQQTQAQLVQTEKMSSLGQLVAGVAHEVKNPLNFIAGNIEYANRYVAQLFELLEVYQTSYPEPVIAVSQKLAAVELEFIQEDLPKLLQSMELGADRIQNIVVSLRNFSRVDEQEKQVVDIHEGLEGTMMILQPRFNATADRAAIRLVRKYGDLPMVECYAGQLNQVVMNLIANAIDAFDEDAMTRSFGENERIDKQITIVTESLDDEHIGIRVIDNGPGMSQKTQESIFEAFFTTKPIGKGTGLGLSISHQIIVEKHGGTIACESQVGTGTTFVIKLPLRQESHTLDFIEAEFLS